MNHSANCRRIDQFVQAVPALAPSLRIAQLVAAAALFPCNGTVIEKLAVFRCIRPCQNIYLFRHVPRDVRCSRRCKPCQRKRLSGTLVAKGDANWAGVGHNSAYTLDGKSIIVMHGYDKRDNGRSKLIIREMKWDRGDWPSIVLSPELTQETVPKTATEVKAAH